jgi:hypothetical protein
MIVQTTTICLLNKQVSRVLLQNQTFLTAIRSVYTTTTQAEMTQQGFTSFALDFHIVPELCTPAQLLAVFDSVNSCEE